MTGRDTGSAVYEPAATMVAARFAAAGLVPAGENGSFLQGVPMQALWVEQATMRVDARPLRFLYEITAYR
jgi:hypothetical protein